MILSAYLALICLFSLSDFFPIRHGFFKIASVINIFLVHIRVRILDASAALVVNHLRKTVGTQKALAFLRQFLFWRFFGSVFSATGAFSKVAPVVVVVEAFFSRMDRTMSNPSSERLLLNVRS